MRPGLEPPVAGGVRTRSRAPTRVTSRRAANRLPMKGVDLGDWQRVLGIDFWVSYTAGSFFLVDLQMAGWLLLDEGWTPVVG